MKKSKTYFLYRDQFNKLQEINEGWISSDDTEVLSIDVVWLKQESMQSENSFSLLPATSAKMILTQNFGIEWEKYKFIHITTK